MPSGEVHSITTGLAAAGSWFVTQPLLGSQASLAVCVGCLAGALLTPDMDVNNGSISNHHARRTFGSVVGVVFLDHSASFPTQPHARAWHGYQAVLPILRSLPGAESGRHSGSNRSARRRALVAAVRLHWACAQ